MDSPSAKKFKKKKSVKLLTSLISKDVAKTTRKNLNFRRPNAKMAFFETMGDESTLQGLMDATETTIGGVHDNAAPQKIDPLVLFHPELSMDGLSQLGQVVKTKAERKEFKGVICSKCNKSVDPNILNQHMEKYCEKSKYQVI